MLCCSHNQVVAMHSPTALAQLIRLACQKFRHATLHSILVPSHAAMKPYQSPKCNPVNTKTCSINQPKKNNTKIKTKQTTKTTQDKRMVELLVGVVRASHQTTVRPARQHVLVSAVYLHHSKRAHLHNSISIMKPHHDHDTTHKP